MSKAAGSAAMRAGVATPGGGRVHSTETAKRLEINWQTRQLPRMYREGYDPTALPLAALFDRGDVSGQHEAKPAMVFFSSLKVDEKLEKKMFDNLEVAVAARWFDCVRIYTDDIDTKAEREAYTKVVPLVIFLDGAGREVARTGGNATTAAGIYAAMQKTAGVDFATSLVSMVEKYSAFLRKLDKVQTQVSDLERELLDDVQHVAQHDCPMGRKQLKAHEEELKPATAERDKLLEQEKALLKPELKKPAAAAEKS
jgi:hypothetical protein